MQFYAAHEHESLTEQATRDCRSPLRFLYLLETSVIHRRNQGRSCNPEAIEGIIAEHQTLYHLILITKQCYEPVTKHQNFSLMFYGEKTMISLKFTIIPKSITDIDNPFTVHYVGHPFCFAQRVFLVLPKPLTINRYFFFFCFFIACGAISNFHRLLQRSTTSVAIAEIYRLFIYFSKWALNRMVLPYKLLIG